MFCTKCGYQPDADAAFCAKCGTPIAPIEATSTGKPLYEQAVPPVKASRSHKKLWLAIASVVAFLYLMDHLGSSGSATYTRASSASSTHKVTYRITGTTTDVDVTYYNMQESSEQQGKVRVPWEVSYSMQSGAFAYISAQNQEDYGRVTCEILMDGDQVKTSHSSGAYVIATCDGRVS